MALLYKRKETEKRVTIVLKHQALYYIVFFGILAITAVFPPLALLSFPFVAIMIFVKLVAGWDANREIRQAMKHGDVKVSGSKFSFKKPLTFEIARS